MLFAQPQQVAPGLLLRLRRAHSHEYLLQGLLVLDMLKAILRQFDQRRKASLHHRLYALVYALLDAFLDTLCFAFLHYLTIETGIFKNSSITANLHSIHAKSASFVKSVLAISFA